MPVEPYLTLAHHAGWANDRLYEACAELSDAELRRDRKAFFRSLHGTLNHILVGDRVWWSRVEGTAHGITRQDTILYDDFRALREARAAEDARIVRLVTGMPPARLDGTLDFVTLDGDADSCPMPVALVNMFNHATHHRGQCHQMLGEAGLDPPPLDIYDYIEAARA